MKKAFNVNIPLFLVELLSLHIALDLLYNVSSSIFSYWVLRYKLQASPDSNEKSQQPNMIYNPEDKPESDYDNATLTGQDINTAMGKLGIPYNLEGGDVLDKLWDRKEIASLFEEEEPSLQELKEVFDVYDKNGDGFIDAQELQRVICGLGLRKGSKLDECQGIIRAFDENGDDKIDFKEFVKFMSDNFN